MANVCVIRNPFDGKELGRLPYDGPAEIREALDQAIQAFSQWKQVSSHERSQLLLGVAARLEARRQEFALLIRDEAGKPVAFAEAEVLRALGVLRWAAAEALRFSGELIRLDASGSGRPGFGIVTRFPRGVILGIAPFNFPLNLLVHKVAPAIACGCPILIKPSPYTPLTAQRFISIFHEIGAPEGLVEMVMADDDATAQLTRSPEIAMISFTGSARVGKMIRAQSQGKPLTLELGGNAWVAVLDDIPESAYPAIARKIASGAFGYAGQSCISVQNVAAPATIADRLERELMAATEATVYGHPADPLVVSGPVINDAAALRIGAELARLPAGSGVSRSANLSSVLEMHEAPKAKEASSRLIPPTLVTLGKNASFPAQSPLLQEEIFGPLMVYSRFDEIQQLIDRINASRYGLQAGIFTQNWAAIERLYRELNVGGVVINDVPTTRYDHQPYGGEKDSGQGREGVKYAMEEMTTPKFLGLSSQLPG